MVHILDNIWQQRITLQGYYQEPLADEAAYDATELHEDAFPTLAVLQERWMIERREMWAYLDTLTEETLNNTIRYVIPGAMRERVVWHILFDVILHATQHRSEAAALLTGYGQAPGDFDFTMFMNERTEMDKKLTHISLRSMSPWVLASVRFERSFGAPFRRLLKYSATICLVMYCTTAWFGLPGSTRTWLCIPEVTISRKSMQRSLWATRHPWVAA
jgi:uncharacterized damage-inducible protein DinB